MNKEVNPPFTMLPFARLLFIVFRYPGQHFASLITSFISLSAILCESRFDLSYILINYRFMRYVQNSRGILFVPREVHPGSVLMCHEWKTT